MNLPYREPDLQAARGRRFAVILVDLQNDFCHPDGVFASAGLRLTGLDALVERIGALAEAARAGGHVAVWTRMVYDSDEEVGLLAQRSPFLASEGLRRGTWGAELVDGLAVEPTDHLLDKRRFSAFFDTELEALLAREGIRDLVVAGVRTDFCVESTVRDALFRDLAAIVPADAVGGFVPDLHEHSLRLMGTVFARIAQTAEVVELLRARAGPTRSAAVP